MLAPWYEKEEGNNGKMKIRPLSISAYCKILQRVVSNIIIYTPYISPLMVL